ncbi:MAG: YchJ family protein [Myxococcales bacterium]|nr:YchJ family protein [Myxococcales bacterium]
MTETCPCQSGAPFARCCEPFLTGSALPPTAEALMRSRYTAFTRADVGYIRDTRHPQSDFHFDEEATRKWATGSKWLGLTILNTAGGGLNDSEGEVEFVARYTVDGQKTEHHERAKFQRDQDRWYFVDGEFVRTAPIRREAPKIGRNDPCSCGSGKKFKKCCGK